MKRKTWGTVILPVLAITGVLSLLALKNDIPSKHNNYITPAADAGLTLPAGFNASIIADNIGGVRHIAVTPQGEIYVKLRGLEKGKGILLLHQNGGKTEIKTGFGNFGGTQPAKRFQSQRSLGLLRNQRVTAGENQAQPIVFDFRFE